MFLQEHFAALGLHGKTLLAAGGIDSHLSKTAKGGAASAAVVQGWDCPFRKLLAYSFSKNSQAEHEM